MATSATRFTQIMKSEVTFTLDLRTVARWILAVLFLWAAVSKLANPTEFLGSLYAYSLPLPRGLVQLAAMVLPWFELFCGGLLLLGIWPESVLVSASGLLGVFILATGQAWARGLKISCGCFDLKLLGLKESLPSLVAFIESPGFAFIRNLILAAIAIYLLRHHLAKLGAQTMAAAVGNATSTTPSRGKSPRATGQAN